MNEIAATMIGRPADHINYDGDYSWENVSPSIATELEKIGAEHPIDFVQIYSNGRQSYTVLVF